MSQPHDAQPPPKLAFGRYEALFRIASGGMAEVFAARIRGEAGFEKLVAVKRMLPHMVEDEHFVDMFLDEARVAVHVASPHVVQTLDLGRAEDGSLYIAMELVIGCSLAVLIREARRQNQRVPIPIAAEIIAQAAQGLDDAHDAVTPTGVQLGIVHRDVSPHNLLVGADGRTRVTDFGIARALMRRTSTAAGELKGKFAYFSPEQADGLPVDRRSDVFALGIVAWECFLGRRLFTGDDMMQILAKVRTAPIPMLHELDEEIPHAISAAVAKALDRDPSSRYASAHDFAAALRDAARPLGRTPSSREIGKWVAEVGAEPLGKIREQIDAALAGDEVETIARPSGPSSASLKRVATAKVVTANTSPPLTLPHTDGEPSTLASTTLPSEGKKKSRAALVVALVVAGALGGVVWVTSREPAASKASATPAENASLTVPVASTPSAPPPVASSAPAPSASSASPPKSLPKSKYVPPTPKTAPSPPPSVVAAPPPPPPPSATETVKKPTGPILGDDAFKVPK